MTLDDLEQLNWNTTYFSVLGVNISQTVGLRAAVARLPLRQLGFLVNLPKVLQNKDCGRIAYVIYDIGYTPTIFINSGAPSVYLFLLKWGSVARDVSALG